MCIQHRDTSRYNVAAIAEVIDLGSRDDVICVTRDLSFAGCFVKTSLPFSKGTEVRVRIRYSGADFAAIGNVTDNVTWEGMGIKFVEIAPRDQALIEDWLGYPNVTSVSGGESSFSQPRCDEHPIHNIPVTVSGQLSTGAFSEETVTRIITSNRALLSLSTAVSAGQVVRLKNRLTSVEQDCRVLLVDPTPEDKPTLLAVEFIEPTQNFWNMPGTTS